MKILLYTAIFLFISIFGAFAADSAAGITDDNILLRERLAKMIDTLIADDLIEGEVQCDDSYLGGHIILRGNKDESLAGEITFTGDSLRGQIRLLVAGDSLDLRLVGGFSEDGLRGLGDFEGDYSAGDFNFHTMRDGEGDFDLYIDLKISRLRLKGKLANICSEKDHIIRRAMHIIDLLGFEDLFANIEGDSVVSYNGLDLKCVASLDLYLRNMGSRRGRLTILNGNVSKYGKSFRITEGYYDFSSGEVFLHGEYPTTAYITLPDSGTVRRSYKVEIVYSGFVADSIEFGFKCSPYLDNDQILNLLIRGSPQEYGILTLNQFDIETLIKRAVQDYHSEEFTHFAERQVGKLVSFDRVVIEGNVFSPGSTFRATKGILGKLELNVRGTVGGVSEQTISFEYPLGRRIYLINETNQYGRTGVDIRFLLRFK